VSTNVHFDQVSAHARAVVWIDHLAAKIFPMGLTGVDSLIVHAHLESSHLHHKANTIGSGRVHDDPSFLKKVDDALQACTEVLIVGPGTEKTALMHHLQASRPTMALRVETSDHPTDGEIIALGKRHFHLD
jgi:stalled ribosome rescue protein Dom34